MLRRVLSPLGLVAFLAAISISATAAHAGNHHQQKPGTASCQPFGYAQNSLFSNYYQTGACGGVPAKMYVAPIPVPQLVGNTYITNEALMPHELLYPHHRHYYRYTNEGRGMTRTSIHYYSPPFSHAAHYIGHGLRIAR
jgi:hypothetical protein